MRVIDRFNSQVENIDPRSMGYVYDAIAYKLFGEGCIKDPKSKYPMVKLSIQDFISTILSYIWNQSRKAVKRQHEKLERGRKEVKDEFDST